MAWCELPAAILTQPDVPDTQRFCSSHTLLNRPGFAAMDAYWGSSSQHGISPHGTDGGHGYLKLAEHCIVMNPLPVSDFHF